MALSLEWLLYWFRILWIIMILTSESRSKKTQTYYMDGSDCDSRKLIGGATVYSHIGKTYSHHIDCRITFKAEKEGWKLLIRLVHLDIPDTSYNQLCNDALYVYDAKDIFGHPMAGTEGVCGNKLPPVLYSSGPFITVYFRTDTGGPRGSGFKFIITAYSDEYARHNSCGSGFHCDNDKCINRELTCDSVDHCGDYSDELSVGAANCGHQDVIAVHKAEVDNATVVNPLTESILKLGVVATVAMTAGSVIVAVVCVACFICCCCRYVQKRHLHDTSSDMCNHHATPATSVTINNGGPHMPMSHSPYQHSTPCAPPHTGYYPMHPVASSQGSHQGVAYSPFRTPNHRESYSHVGSTYSQAPPSYHRSVTPTSSRSGRSHHSHHSNDGSVKYAQCDRVSMPVNL